MAEHSTAPVRLLESVLELMLGESRGGSTPFGEDLGVPPRYHSRAGG